MFTHIFVAGVFGKACGFFGMPARFWLLAAFCSVLPDVDIVGYYYFGIKYGSMFGHRGFFHSLFFAFLVSSVTALLAFPTIKRFSKKWWGIFGFFFMVIASHGFLDSMTDKGMGVGFFMPFDNTRYFMPWRPIYASPMSIQKFFSGAGIDVLVREIIWVWIPMLLIYSGVWWVRKRKRNG
ncbi:MAG: metal-dependent hydrolase [Nitrospirota bacterium]